MALTKPISVPVLPGIREDVSAHLAPLGTLLSAKNVRFIAQGEAQARPGTTALSAATSAAITYATICGDEGPEYLAPVPGGFVFGSKGFGYRYDSGQERVHVAGSYGNALPAGRLVTMAREELVVDPLTSTPYPLSQAVTDGYVGVLYSITSGGSGGPENCGYLVQIYTESGTLVASFDQLGLNVTAGYIIADPSVPGTFIIVKQGITALQAAVITVDSTGATKSLFSAVGIMNADDSQWAVCPWPGVGWAVVYQSAVGTLTVKQFSGQNVLNTATFAVDGTLCPLSCYANATYLYVGWCRAGAGPYDAMVRVYTAAMAVSVSGAVVQAEASGQFLTPPLFGAHVSGNGTAFCVVGWSTNAGDAGTRMRACTVNALTGVATSAGTDGDAYGLFPISMPFNNGMVWCRREMGTGILSLRNMLVDYQLDRVGSSYLKNPKVALVTDELLNPVGLSAFRGGWYRQHLGFVARKSTGEWVFGSPRVVRLEPHDGGSAGLTLAEWLLFETDAPRQVASVTRDAIVPGDPVTTQALCGTVLDATTAVQTYGSDLGFYSQPIISLAVASAAAGDLFNSTQYQYRAVVERIDASGARHRSAPSGVYTTTTGAADNTVTITVLYAPEQLRSYGRSSSTVDPSGPSRNVVHIYRTAASAAGTAGQQFQRCTPPQGAPMPVLGTLTYVDELSDENLREREFLYTDGGVLNNDHPPSCRYVAVSEDRVWLAGLWEPRLAQSSKIIVPGEPPQFSDLPSFQVLVPDDITGIAAQDGVVIFFTAGAIYALQGAGPTDQGQGAWDSPRVVTRSTGCVNAASIVETSAGIFFQSSRGIEMVPRGVGEPIFVGEAIQTTLAEGLMVIGAAVVSTGAARTVRFCLGTTQVLVFDLEFGAWSIDEYPFAVSKVCQTDEGAVFARLEPSAGGFGFLLEGPAVTQDSVGDSPMAIASELEWADVRPFTIAGWGRFNGATGLIDSKTGGYVAGNCSLFVTVDNDADPGATFAMAGLESPDYLQHIPRRMDGVAARLKFTTAAAGWRFAGWTLDMDEHGGSKRMAQGKRG